MKYYRLFLFFFLAIGFQGCHVPQRPAEPFTFTILQLNDVYEISPLEGGKAGGLARVAALRQRLLEENPNTITVIAGDFMSPSLMATLRMDNGERIAGLQMIETLNALGMDYATFGNHEFDLSDGELTQRRFQQCQFRFICANARKKLPDGTTAPFTQVLNGQPVSVPDYWVHEFTDAKGRKFRLGLTGVLLPYSQKDYVAYLPVEESLRQAVKALQPVSDAIVAITHLDAAEDQKMALAVPGIPLFLGGHDHEHMMLTSGRSLIAKADANAKTVYVHRCSFNPATRQFNVQSTLETIGPKLPDEPLTQLVVEKWQNLATETMRKNGFEPSQVVATVKEPLECKETDVRSRPTNFGQLTTRSFEMAWPGADLYLLNSGSMRLDDNISGTITQYDILRTYPFGGGIAMQEIPGADVLQILQTGLVTNKTTGGYLQTHNAQEVNGAWQINGKTIEQGKTYKVVSTDFLASGREANLAVFGKYPPNIPKEFALGNGQKLRNDIRELVIAKLANP